MNIKKILVAGLQETGKTTFIAALWHFVNLKLSNKNLILHSLAKGEHEYLNSICNDWLEYKDLQRTNNSPAGESITMSLKSLKSNKLIELEIPDFSGETFKYQFANREWTLEYDRMLDKINGILLFVNPKDSKNRPHLIKDANDAANIMGGEELISNQNVEFKQWELEDVPNQVKLVDILQFIQHFKPEVLPVKIILMVSAWDMVEDCRSKNTILPEYWFKLNLPLLYQFINCNAESFQPKYIGISAQGCDYGNEAEVNESADKDISERIIIKDGDEYYNDITKPLVWLTE